MQEHARLEKAGLIQRDFFKAKATKAPPIKVLVDNILEYTGDIESMSQGDIESISPTDIESISQVTKKVCHPDIGKYVAR